MISDSTKGSPLRLTIGFMILTCLGNLLQQFCNLVDPIIAGRFIGVGVLAAVGSTSFSTFLVIGRLNRVTNGFAIIIARQFGVKRYDRIRHYLVQPIYPCVAFVVVVIMGLSILNYPILRVMNTPETIVDEASSYTAVIHAGLMVTVAYNALAAVLRALGDEKPPLYFLIMLVVLNIIMDIVFIVYFRIGVVRCGYATIIAQTVSALLCLLYIIKKFDVLRPHRPDFELSAKSMGQLFAIGTPMGLQLSITATGAIIVQGAINVFDSTYITGFSAGGKIQNVARIMSVALGTIIATFVRQNHGAGRMDRVKEDVRVTQILTPIWSALMVFAIHLFGKYLIMIFMDSAETQVMEAALTYFRMVSQYYPFLGSIFLYRNALQGSGYDLVPMLGGVFELLVRTGVVVAISGIAGYAGVYLSDPAAWMAALIPIVPYYLYKVKKADSTLRESRL